MGKEFEDIGSDPRKHAAKGSRERVDWEYDFLRIAWKYAYLTVSGKYPYEVADRYDLYFGLALKILRDKDSFVKEDYVDLETLCTNRGLPLYDADALPPEFRQPKMQNQ
jgi:hypothetical protein